MLGFGKRIDVRKALFSEIEVLKQALNEWNQQLIRDMVKHLTMCIQLSTLLTNFQ